MSDPVPPLPTCPCGEPIRPDPPDPDGIATWKCSGRWFGILLPDDYLKAHPSENRVMICGRKRIHSVPARVAA
ncbi:hypothetical protein ABTZ03_31515 [Kitasatospora sp. NPDC096077]|uniref:hypothetical protein n=1 Tax=Kitasatospora sp. NPDC096077 TaxID=3155544 RepID=UPI0033206C52